jgi:hypothetical protein
MSSSARHMTPRPSRTVPATIMGVILLTMGALGLWIVGTRLLTGEWPAQTEQSLSTIGELQMDSMPMLITLIALALLGLMMLLAALWPGRRMNHEVFPDEVPGTTVMRRHDIAHRITHALERTDGVQRARTHLSRRRAEVTVYAVVPDQEMRARAHAAAQGAIEELSPQVVPRIHLRLRHGS